MQLRNHVGDFLDEDSLLYHYAIGMAGGGIPSAGMLAFAVAEGDTERVKEAALVEAAVLGTQYSMLQAINYVSGPKYAMSFHRVHQGMNVMRGMATRSLMSTALGPLAGVYAFGLGMKYVFGETERVTLSGSDVTTQQRIAMYTQ